MKRNAMPSEDASTRRQENPKDMYTPLVNYPTLKGGA
jgi:hypothetical protein